MPRQVMYNHASPNKIGDWVIAVGATKLTVKAMTLLLTQAIDLGVSA